MNKWTPWIVGSLCLATMAACSGNKGDTNSGAAGSETGTMQGGTATDTGMAGGTGMVTDTAAVQPSTGATGGESADTARTSGRDSAKGNQTKSGVTDTKTGKSTLGKGVTQTSPDQNQPVTAKGDTVRPPNDSTAVGQQ
jgi:hypothetical protein